MSQVKVQGDPSGTGVFTIAAPNSNSNVTLTLPATTGTLLTGASAIAKSQLPSGSILQIATATAEGVLTTTANGAPTTITNGVQVFSTSFTPIRNNSILWVQTSTIAISEASNTADICWLALWDGSTFISANSATWGFTSFANNCNGSYTAINDGWQVSDTNTRTIQVRAAMNGGSGTTYVNGNSPANYGSSSARVRMLVWEIAV